MGQYFVIVCTLDLDHTFFRCECHLHLKNYTRCVSLTPANIVCSNVELKPTLWVALTATVLPNKSLLRPSMASGTGALLCSTVGRANLSTFGDIEDQIFTIVYESL